MKSMREQIGAAAEVIRASGEIIGMFEPFARTVARFKPTQSTLRVAHQSDTFAAIRTLPAAVNLLH